MADWTEERVETLKRLCAEGHAFSRIGAILGITRSAAIGKAARLKLNKSRARPTSPTRQKPVTSSGKCLLTPPHRDFETKMKPAVPKQKKQDDSEPVPLMVPLLDLTDQSCRWPYGDPLEEEFGFCGHKTEFGGPYCKFHQRISREGFIRAKPNVLKKAA